jgi:hypothetical protein
MPPPITFETMIAEASSGPSRRASAEGVEAVTFEPTPQSVAYLTFQAVRAAT